MYLSSFKDCLTSSANVGRRYASSTNSFSRRLQHAKRIILLFLAILSVDCFAASAMTMASTRRPERHHLPLPVQIPWQLLLPIGAVRAALGCPKYSRV
jgi:hypothetical protein